MNITPTVGRVVYFNPNGMQLASDFRAPRDGEPLAAIVAAVLPNGVHLNLSVIDALGQHHAVTSVPLVQEGQPEPEAGPFAYWMPYQLAQAGIKPMTPPAPVPAAPASAGQGPSVNAVRIDALVASLTYETAHVPGTNTDVATARLPGGFVVCVGENHCLSTADYDADLGRKYAIEDAERKARAKLWEFEGYALYLHLEQIRAAGVGSMPAHQQRVVLEKIENRDRADKLAAFIGTRDQEGSIFGKLPEAEQDRMYRQLNIMRELDAVLAERINAFPVSA